VWRLTLLIGVLPCPVLRPCFPPGVFPHPPTSQCSNPLDSSHHLFFNPDVSLGGHPYVPWAFSPDVDVKAPTYARPLVEWGGGSRDPFRRVGDVPGALFFGASNVSPSRFPPPRVLGTGSFGTIVLCGHGGKPGQPPPTFCGATRQSSITPASYFEETTKSLGPGFFWAFPIGLFPPQSSLILPPIDGTYGQRKNRESARDPFVFWFSPQFAP